MQECGVVVSLVVVRDDGISYPQAMVCAMCCGLMHAM
jgi:hypothetical protein